MVLPPDLDPLAAAFCEPLACTLHGVDLGAPAAGERALVIGGGVIGLLALQLARLAGAETMLLTRTAGKRALARELGAAETAATPEEAAAIWPRGADLTLECAGAAETVAAAPALTRAGGRVVVLGVLPKGARVPIEPFDLLFREIQLRFAFINPFTQARAADLIAGGRDRRRAADLPDDPARGRGRNDREPGRAGRDQGRRRSRRPLTAPPRAWAAGESPFPSASATLADSDVAVQHRPVSSKLNIAVVEKDHDRALMIVDGLRDAGDYEITVIGDVTSLARRLAALSPDVVLIDLENPDRDVLDALTLASRAASTGRWRCSSTARTTA